MKYRQNCFAFPLSVVPQGFAEARQTRAGLHLNEDGGVGRAHALSKAPSVIAPCLKRGCASIAIVLLP